MAKPPKAALEYMHEFDETEADFRAWVHSQRDAYLSIGDRTGTDLSVWLAHKMTTTRAGASSVLKWAGIENA